MLRENVYSKLKERMKNTDDNLKKTNLYQSLHSAGEEIFSKEVNEGMYFNRGVNKIGRRKGFRKFIVMAALAAGISLLTVQTMTGAIQQGFYSYTASQENDQLYIQWHGEKNMKITEEEYREKTKQLVWVPDNYSFFNAKENESFVKGITYLYIYNDDYIRYQIVTLTDSQVQLTHETDGAMKMEELNGQTYYTGKNRQLNKIIWGTEGGYLHTLEGNIAMDVLKEVVEKNFASEEI